MKILGWRWSYGQRRQHCFIAEADPDYPGRSPRISKLCRRNGRMIFLLQGARAYEDNPGSHPCQACLKIWNDHGITRTKETI